MESIKEIKRRITSVKNTRQITKAMKMVSAAKLKRAQDEIVAARPYAEKMLDLIASLASKASSDSHPLLENRGGNRVGLLIFTSDRGLCGSFNSQILRNAERFLRERGPVEASVYTIGKRGGEYFKRRGLKIINSKNMGSGRAPDGAAPGVDQETISAFKRGGVEGR